MMAWVSGWFLLFSLCFGFLFYYFWRRAWIPTVVTFVVLFVLLWTQFSLNFWPFLLAYVFLVWLGCWMASFARRRRKLN
jgi:hypothetical protein